MPDDVSLAGFRVMVTRPSGDWSIFRREGPFCQPTQAENMDLSPSAAPIIGTVPSDDPLAARLRELGAEVLVQPAIRISPPPDWRPVDDALSHLSDYDWLVFSSANGVRALLERWRHEGREGEAPAEPNETSASVARQEPRPPRFSPPGGDGAGHGRRTRPLRPPRQPGAGAVLRGIAGRGIGAKCRRRGKGDSPRLCEAPGGDVPANGDCPLFR